MKSSLSFTSLPVLLRCAAREPLEVFAEETGVGEMEGVGNFRHLPVAVAQHHLRLRDDGAVYPLLGCDAARLPYHRAQVTLRETQLAGVEGEGALLAAMAVHQYQEAVEDVGGGGTVGGGQG